MHHNYEKLDPDVTYTVLQLQNILLTVSVMLDFRMLTAFTF